MKLQYKAWALVFAIVGLAAGSAMLGARYIVGESFAQLETDRAQREGERARRVLDQQVQALSATNRDYAQWVDAVDFLQGRKPEFMDDNFDVGNLGYLRISEVAVFDAKGGLVTSVTVDDQGRKVAVPATRIEPLRPLAQEVLASADPLHPFQTLRVADGQLAFDGAEVNTIDGLRVDWADGFGLIRGSNTTPVLVLRFEGHTQDALHRIEGVMMAALKAVKPDAKIAAASH